MAQCVIVLLGTMSQCVTTLEFSLSVTSNVRFTASSKRTCLHVSPPD